MTEAFERAVAFVIEQEGVYSNDPDDAGGETRYGISKASYPDLDILHLTESEAIEIYHRDFWLRCRCNDLPERLGEALFNAAVNVGVGRAGSWLQDALNSLGASLRLDGAIGPRTVATTQEVEARGQAEAILLKFLARWLAYYYSLRHKRPKYFGGWVGRVARLMDNL